MVTLTNQYKRRATFMTSALSWRRRNATVTRSVGLHGRGTAVGMWLSVKDGTHFVGLKGTMEGSIDCVSGGVNYRTSERDSERESEEVTE